jgi:hypothetical protein
MCLNTKGLLLKPHLEIRDVLENEGVADGDLFTDSVVHGVDVRLVDTHALLGERRRVVNRNVM